MDNEKCYFFFSGYYVVASASDVLNRYNIPNRIVRAPVSMKDSCNFALLIDGAYEKTCENIFKREQVKVEEKKKAKTKV